MQKVIIVGATSGIGRELARLYAGAGDLVGVTGRRQDLLYSLVISPPFPPSRRSAATGIPPPTAPPRPFKAPISKGCISRHAECTCLG